MSTYSGVDVVDSVNGDADAEPVEQEPATEPTPQPQPKPTDDFVVDSLATHFSPAFAYQAFACLVRHPAKFNLGIIEATTFAGEGQLHRLATVALTHYRKYGSMPSLAIIKDEAGKEIESIDTIPDAKKDEFFNAIAADIDELEATNTEEGELAYVLDRMGAWVQKTRAMLALKECFESIKDGTDSDKIRKAKTVLADVMDAPAASAMEVTSLADFVKEEIDPPQELVEGLLDCGDIVLLGGASKSRKTWMVLDLAVSVAAGLPWLGRPTEAGPVMFLNFELKRYNVRQRLLAILEAKVKGNPDAKRIVAKAMKNFHISNLRGKSLSPDEILANLAFEMRGRQFKAFVIDPVYMFLAGREENSNEQIIEMLSGFARLSYKTGAMGVLTHHFSKGNKAEADLLDRFSGAGAFGRFIDAGITLLPLDETQPKHSYKVDLILRNKVDVESFGVTWEHPLMVADAALDLTKVKAARGRKEKYPLNGFLTVFKDQEVVTRKEWYEHMATVYPGISPTTMKDKILDLVKVGKVRCQEKDLFTLTIDSATKGTPPNFKEQDQPVNPAKPKNRFSAAKDALGR